MLDYNPIEQMGGALVGILMKKKGNPLKKGAASLALILLAPIALLGFVARKSLNPLNTFKGAMGLMAYSLAKNSYLLKALTAIFVGPIVLLSSLPALLPFSFKTLITDPIKKLFKPNLKQIMAAELSLEAENRNILSLEKRLKIESNQAKNQAAKENIKDLDIEIQETDPKKALMKFMLVLAAHPYAIPSFDKITFNKVAKYLQSKSTSAEGLKMNTDYRKASQQAIECVMTAQKAIPKGEPLALTKAAKQKIRTRLSEKTFLAFSGSFKTGQSTIRKNPESEISDTLHVKKKPKI